MVEELADILREDLPEFAFRIELDDNDQIRWRTTIDGVEVVETSEPQTGGWRRFKAMVLKLVPDSQL